MCRRTWLQWCLATAGIVVGLSAAALAQPAPTTTPLPRVRLIATGGTISAHASGRLTGRDLLARLSPASARVADVDAEQFSNVPSTNLTLAQYASLARRIDTRFTEDPSLDGIVVTTGTDALEELAYFLHLTVKHERPVVVTGAMRNASDAEYDGAANLQAAIQVAADRSARGRGVLVVMHGAIHGARNVTKVDTEHIDAFISDPDGPLGSVSAEGVVFKQSTGRRFGRHGEFDAASLGILPRVDVLITYQDAPRDAIDAAVDGGARGLVVAGSGAGSLSGGQREGLRTAASRGVVVVRASRTLRGRVTAALLVEPDGRPNAQGHVAAGELSAVKARILLMLALTKTREPRQIQRIFDEY